MWNTSTLSNPEDLLHSLRDLRRDVNTEARDLYTRWLPHIERRAFCIGAFNLACYLALRQRDLRSLQSALMPWGLSSLGRSEARVLPNLDAVIATLEKLVDPSTNPRHPHLSAFFRGQRMLDYHTDRLFGPEPLPHRHVRIMVTFPSTAADDYAFVRELVRRGMNCARINCAHDDADVWSAMVANVRRAATEVGRHCTILMDLGGPKSRTADISDEKMRLKVADRFLLTKEAVSKPGDGYVMAVRCALPEVFDQLEAGQSVWIDDGKLGAVIERLIPEGAVLRVIHARAKGERIKPEKGLNFPETDLRLDPLTADDLTALDFAAHNADMIGYSFVQEARDIEHLQDELKARRGDDWRKLAIIAKIETRRAIANLPELIVSAAGEQPFGVMIARGDLGVEVGYERMAEIQEEILWLCEAAHIPVIWATEVLERFVSKGTPSRSEMTDAAMSVRAECVMLNKGPYQAEAVTILDNVLTRMQEHQTKKTPQLRALKAWQDVVARNEA
jgi:pyruvate kinase